MEEKSGHNLLGFHSMQKACSTIRVGIKDEQSEAVIGLNGVFLLNDGKEITGTIIVEAKKDSIIIFDKKKHIVSSGQDIRFKNKGDSTFTLFDVAIGIGFHWEKKERQVFKGDLVLKRRPHGTIAIINEIEVEDYLKSVISSEMKSTAPIEFLKAHAIISRSWLIYALKEKDNVLLTKERKKDQHCKSTMDEDQIIRFYEQESHDLYDVCADDHCQRYQGITKISTENPVRAVIETSGIVLTYNGLVCDARYSKACGGITEEYKTAWKDMDIPYLKSIYDGEKSFSPILTEKDAKSWICSRPDAFCNIKDREMLRMILPDFDIKTKDFFRWQVRYKRKELEDIICKKSGYDLGKIQEIKPLKRGPSGRIFLLEIRGTKKTIRIGKELEIRRWLSHTHLLSSAFVIEHKYDDLGDIDTFTFYGAGWGHGVGLCQIGAGVMALKGYKAEEILRHYFPGTRLEKIY
ncbi:MAG TPA: SpoIID/LytB domain-containing protein [Syntrophorhabdaceae bacterium]|nr:SpoIID/LytB domain-containing protein [Syntrophorhabdaceae bacterium]